MRHSASWSSAQTGSGADLAAADAKAAAQELASKLAMHVVAMRPPYLSRETGARDDSVTSRAPAICLAL